MADLMWITPLRDGLNLVCKEYVATQGLSGGRGVLVLSEFAGAAGELKGAILTNPHDIEDLQNRAEARRDRKECVSTCRCRWSPCHQKNNNKKENKVR